MAKKASEAFKTYHNENGATVSSVNRKIISENGLIFKDIDGTGEVSVVNDWRKPAADRAAAYCEKLTLKEKIAQLFISDWRLAKYPLKTIDNEKHEIITDETGILDEGEFNGKTIFGEQHLPGTSHMIKEWFARHVIFRANATVEDMVDWLNQMNAVAEDCEHFIPVQAASNSRNENGEVVFGMNDASGVFATWPGTLGIAAAVMGSGIEVADNFADCIKKEWNACGLRKGYMYMADVMSDPRWQRSFGTFGENPELISNIMEHIIPRIQGSKEGVTTDGVAMTVKHFPGGGARENGFDPHYAAGQWNVYATKGSLYKYHIPAFRKAVEYNASSIMPYYSKPSEAKSEAQYDDNGKLVSFKPYGFAYNKYFINDILRGELGFKGYINTDTGITHNMSWGVEKLDVPERIGFAVNQAGVDIISGLFDMAEGMEAYERSKNGYYETHTAPEGFKPEELVLTDEALDRAVTNTLTEMFRLGMFDDTYRNSDNAKEAVADKKDWEAASLAHKQSVVLLKNQNLLPLTDDKLAGKKVYAEAFAKDSTKAEAATKALKEMLENENIIIAENPQEADFALLMVNPSSGAYFSATPGYLELDICENKEVVNVDENNCPLNETHLETTLHGAGHIKELSDILHSNGGKVVACINFPLAWIVSNVEKYADVLVAGFDTYPSALLDVIRGRYTPTGKLPITLPRGDEVIAVDKNGICASPNDVPGYDKDNYISEELKDENGKAYAYRDTCGNYYEFGFGLKY